MDQSGTSSDKDQNQKKFNLTIAAVTGQVGCLTLVIIFLALFGGLWLDNALQTKPLFTLVFLIGSVPVTLILMFWVVRKTTAHIKPSSAQEAKLSQEEAVSGK